MQNAERPRQKPIYGSMVAANRALEMVRTRVSGSGNVYTERIGFDSIPRKNGQERIVSVPLKRPFTPDERDALRLPKEIGGVKIVYQVVKEDKKIR